jgi:hypothetical protein
MSEEKENNTDNKRESKNKEVIFETAYEKVLFIINKVKEFIKKASSTENKLIQELDWVIKIIASKSLYTYEIVKEELIKQNEEYNKYINFVKKYSEEIIQMNKKHDIVSGILQIRKKGEILLKPSLFLKKMDKMDIIEEMKSNNNKSNFVSTFGNYILNLYNAKNKKNVNEKKDSNFNNNSDNNNSNSENKKEDNKNVINEIINENEEVIDDTIDNNNNEKKKKENNNNEIYKYILPKEKKVISEKENSDRNINVNINGQKIKILNKNMNYKSKSNSKLINPNSQEIHRKKYKELIRLTKNEQNNFNHIKNFMKNYYLNFAFNDQLMSNGYPYLIKADFNIIKQNNNINLMPINNYYKRYRSSNEKNYNLYINNKPRFFPFKINNNKSKNNYAKNNIVSLSVQANNDLNEEKLENSNKTSKKYLKTEKIQSQSPERKEKKVTINENQPLDSNNLNKSKNKINTSIRKKRESVPLVTFINEHINDVKDITSFDFNIFELKKKIGYDNILPIMGFAVLKTLGLADNKIISIKKLKPFLKSVSNSYLKTTLYHNSLHGADVTQSLMVFFLNSNSEEICETTVLDLLGMIISAMGHDLGHPGLNNGFHINASTELGITYNDKSCLENFHSAYLFRILRKEENNILEKFSVQNYKTIRKRMISQILATDMANHGENISLIRSKIKSRQYQEKFLFLSGNDKTKFEEQQILLDYLIHMADLGHNCKKFDISVIWIQLLCEEFWAQGDQERERGLPISFMCDRNNIDVPASQIGFLRGFILSSFDTLVEMFPKLQFTIDNAENNIKQWTKFQSEKKLLGWDDNKNDDNKNDNEEI